MDAWVPSRPVGGVAGSARVSPLTGRGRTRQASAPHSTHTPIDPDTMPHARTPRSKTSRLHATLRYFRAIYAWNMVRMPAFPWSNSRDLSMICHPTRSKESAFVRRPVRKRLCACMVSRSRPVNFPFQKRRIVFNFYIRTMHAVLLSSKVSKGFVV